MDDQKERRKRRKKKKKGRKENDLNKTATSTLLQTLSGPPFTVPTLDVDVRVLKSIENRYLKSLNSTWLRITLPHSISLIYVT